ncbi:MAG: hypothetical protein IJU01_03920 [Lachnospiraceae bacterium]|nr:hypothetical protein [Lachnospiraceae bacterium]
MYEVPDLPLESLLYSSITPAPVPSCVWDMEELPADLVESGDATNRAASLETAKVVTSLTSASGKGFGGTKALAWNQLDEFDNMNDYTVITKNLKGFAQGWKNAEMFWVWVNAADLTADGKLDIRINGNYMPIGESYYTVGSSGKVVRVGSIPKGYGNTTTIGRIPVKAGFQGWIGVETKIYQEVKCVSSFKLHFFKNINKNDKIYFDEFWITKLGQAPDYSASKLNYRTLRSVGSATEIWNMKDLRSNPTTASWAWLDKGNKTITSLVKGAAGTGYAENVSLGYKANMTNPESTALKGGHEYYHVRLHSSDGVSLYKYTWQNQSGKILWFYLNASQATSSNLYSDIQINGNKLKSGTHYYTIAKDSSGKLNIVDKGALTTQQGMEYARLHVEAGLGYWVGIPMSAWDDPVTIRQFSFRMLRALQKDQTVYISDFWVCSKGKMPDIDPKYIPAPLDNSSALIWNVDSSKVSAGKSIATIVNDASKNTIKTTIDTAHTFLGKGKALAYTLTQATNGQGMNMKLYSSELKTQGFDSSVIISEDDVLWFWVYSDTSCEQLLHMELNGKFLKEGSSLYIIEDDGAGNAVAKKILWEENAQTEVTDPTVVPSAFTSNHTYARIKLPIGWSGFIGIPIGSFSANSKGEDSASPAGGSMSEMTFRLYNNQKAPSVGDTVYFDEFWISSKGRLPGLSDEKLLYKYTAPKNTSGTVLDFERGWYENAELDEKQTKPGRTRYWGYTVWASGQKIEQVSFVKAKSEGLSSKVSGTVLKWNILDTWVGVGDGSLGGLKKCAGGFAYLNLTKQWNAQKDLSSYQSYVAYIDASKAKNSVEIEMRLIESDANGLGQQWQTYGPTGALSSINYYIETESGSWKPAGSFQGRAIVPAGYTGRLLVEFDDMVHISEKDAVSTGLYGSDETLQRDLVSHFGISIRGTKGDVVYVDNMGVLKNKVSTLSNSTVRFTSLYGDNMIFRQNKEFAVQGYGTAGSTVNVTLAKNGSTVQAVSTTVLDDGTWKVIMNPVSGSYSEYTLTASSGGKTDKIKGVVFGEVWFTGGQSNMQLRVHECDGWMNLFAGDWKNNNIRIYRQQPVGEIDMTGLGKSNPSEPLGTWGTGSDWTDVYACTALGYYTAVNLQEKLGVPIGIINSAVGGTGVTAWMDRDEVTSSDYPELSSLISSLKYDNTSSGALNYVGNYFNTRIAPFDGYKVSGILWYQGEHDKSNADLQKYGLVAVDRSWSKVLRADSSDTELLPLVSMQMAPYATLDSDSSMTALYNLNSRIAEGTEKIVAEGAKALSIPTYDFDVRVDNIHPTNKYEVGERAAESIYGLIYVDKICSGPVIQNAVYDSGSKKLTLTFTNTGSGLTYKKVGSRLFDDPVNSSILPGDHHDDRLNGFTVWTGLSFVSVEAEIIGENTVVLTLPEGADSAAGIYYGYGTRLLASNLYNNASGGYSFPALPFYYSMGSVVIPEHSISLWDSGDAAGINDGTSVGKVLTNAARSTVSGTIAAEKGMINGSSKQTNALAYTLTKVVTTGSDAQANTLTVNLTSELGANDNITPASEDIIWFWVDTSISGPQTMFVYPNGLSTKMDNFYTIKNSGGTPVIVSVAKGSSYHGIGLENHGSSGWQRFTLVPGACGWIGIPVKGLSGLSGNLISSLQIFTRSYSPAMQADGDAVYFDEFWVTSAGRMPDLSNDQLLYTKYVSEAYNERVWDIDSLDTGSTLPSVDSMANRGAMAFSVENKKGIGGSKAFAMTVSEKSTDAGIINGTLNKENWKTKGVTGFVSSRAVEDDVFWFWVDNELGQDQYVVVEFINGTNTAKGTPTAVSRSNVLYVIADDGNGNPVRKSLAPGSTIGSITNDNSTTRGAIKVPDGGYGWIGIPLSDVEGMSGKTVDGFRIYVRSLSGNDNGIAGKSIYFDEFWITDGSLPELTSDKLLYTKPVVTAYSAKLWDLESLTGTVVFPSKDTTKNRGTMNFAVENSGICSSAAFTMNLATASGNSGIINGTKNQENWVTAGVSGFTASRAVQDGDIFWVWVDNKLGEDEYVVAEFTSGTTKIGGTPTAVSRTNVLYTIGDDGSGKAAIKTLSPGSTIGSITNDITSTRGAIKVASGGYGWIGIPLSDIDGMTGNTLDGIRLYVRSMSAATNGTFGGSIVFDGFWVTSAGTLPALTNEELLYTK